MGLGVAFSVAIMCARCDAQRRGRAMLRHRRGLRRETPPQAQSQTWGGPASTPATAGYKVGTNWSHPPAGAPIAAGKSAIFDTTGSSAFTFGAGGITPGSRSLNANAQSYAIPGAAVNFSATGGLFNHANAGQTISISNALGESAAGAQLQQLGNST